MTNPKVTPIGNATLRPPSVCEGCQGICGKSVGRYFQQLETAEGTWFKPCKFGLLKRLRRTIPVKFATLTFNEYQRTPDNERAIGLAKKLCTERSKGLYLYGGAGTGKTFLASLIAKSFALDGLQVEFKNVPALFDELKSHFDGDVQGILTRYFESDLLILDDLGAGQMSEWSVGVIGLILNERYNSNRLTVVTSNFDLRGLEERLASKDSYSATRIISRLKEMCWQGFLGIKDRRNCNETQERTARSAGVSTTLG